MRKANRKGPKSKVDFEKSPTFYEELTILKAQELITDLMDDRKVSKSDLARLLGQSKSHMTELLSGERNLTLKTLGKICFHLGTEVILDAEPIGQARYNARGYLTSIFQNTSEASEYASGTYPLASEAFQNTWSGDSQQCNLGPTIGRGDSEDLAA